MGYEFLEDSFSGQIILGAGNMIEGNLPISIGGTAFGGDLCLP